MSSRALAFSLMCAICDAGIGISSRDEARRLGWTDLFRDDCKVRPWAETTPGARDCRSWTWIGLCPDCRKEEYGDYEPATAQLTAEKTPLANQERWCDVNR